MGYEVIYHYQEKSDKGFSDEIKQYKKRVGDPYEDFPLENLSGLICCQLARRDIYVKDVEIYEITKKRIKFKETKNGIILKNKKYLFDENFKPIFNCEVEENEKENPNIQDLLDKSVTSGGVKNTSVGENLTRVIKTMTYVPEPPQHVDLLKKGIKLTPNKNYKIYKIENHINGVNEIYTIIDDKEIYQKVSDLYFVPIVSLTGDNDHTESAGLSDDGLSWGGVINDSVPQIRR